MGTKSNRYKGVCLVAASLFAACPAIATPEPVKPLVLNAKYTIAWSGIPLGRILLEANEDTASYHMSIDTKTKGIGALVTDATQVVSVAGTKSGDSTYLPTKYISRPHKLKDDSDVITLTFDGAGNLASRIRTHDDDPAWRPPVPTEKANTARDPITAAFILRRKLYAALGDASATVSHRTYDGMRLADMSLTRAPEAKVAIMDSYLDTIPAIIQRKPIDGYTPKELKKYTKGDPEIRIYFSKDADFLPVRATAKAPLGELSMTLVEKR